MRNKTALTLIAAIAIPAASAFGQGYHYNNGYLNNPWDNWSTRGNYNPFTGLPGTRTPQGPHYDQNGVYHPY
jgi:hypothetical protein